MGLASAGGVWLGGSAGLFQLKASSCWEAVEICSRAAEGWWCRAEDFRAMRRRRASMLLGVRSSGSCDSVVIYQCSEKVKSETHEGLHDCKNHSPAPP